MRKEIICSECLLLVTIVNVETVCLQIEGLQRHPRYGARLEPRAYRNMYDGLRRILLEEGWAGLYKGIVPSIVKAAPAGAVTFVAYEYTSDWLESILT